MRSQETWPRCVLARLVFKECGSILLPHHLKKHHFHFSVFNLLTSFLLHIKCFLLFNVLPTLDVFFSGTVTYNNSISSILYWHIWSFLFLLCQMKQAKGHVSCSWHADHKILWEIWNQQAVLLNVLLGFLKKITVIHKWPQLQFFALSTWSFNGLVLQPDPSQTAIMVRQLTSMGKPVRKS